MSQTVKQEGTYRIEITNFRVSSPEVSVTVFLDGRILECWDPDSEQWVDWRGSDVVAEGSINIVKKDGRANALGVESLGAAGWDGADISLEGWKPRSVHTFIKFDADQRNNGKYAGYKFSILNDYNSTPRGAALDPQKAQQINTQCGGEFRAILGNVARNTPASEASATSAPPSPPVAESPTAAPDAANTAFSESAPTNAPSELGPDGKPIPF